MGNLIGKGSSDEYVIILVVFVTKIVDEAI